MFVHVLLMHAQEEHCMHTIVQEIPWHGLRYFCDDRILMHSLAPMWQQDGLWMQSLSDVQYFSPSVVVVICETGIGDLARRMKDIRKTISIGTAICACATSFPRLAIPIYPFFVLKQVYFPNSLSAAKWVK
jgi:hypothetical protein